MANERRTKRLADLGRIVTGKTPPTIHPEYYGGDVPFVTPSDMDGRRWIDATDRYLTSEGVESVRTSFVPQGALIVSCIGSDMGKVAMAERGCVTNQQINSLIVVAGDNPIFVYYCLSQMKDEIRSVAGGSAVPILNKTGFGDLLIEVPKIQEQRTIAHILGTLDDKIELNRRMNETLEGIARALFKSWFVDFDPVRAKAEGRDPGLPKEIADLFPDRFVGSKLGEIPEGWGVARLGEITENPRRGINPRDFVIGTPYIGLEHMPRKSISLADWGKADDLESQKFEFKRGEILFGKLRSYFHKVGVAPLDGICSTDILVVVPRNPVWFGLVLGHLSSEEFIEHTSASSTGTRMPRTNWGDMERFMIALPPEDLAAHFSTLIRPMVQKIVTNIHAGRTLAGLRDTQLPKLLSGEMRIGEAIKFAGDVK